MSEPRPIIKEQLDRSIEEAIEGVSRIKDVFNSTDYDLNVTVENELDFLLGALYETIVAINYVHLRKLRLKPTSLVSKPMTTYNTLTSSCFVLASQSGFGHIFSSIRTYAAPELPVPMCCSLL